MITIDGVNWEIPCDMKRNSNIRPSDISGWMLNGSFFNDVEGQFLSYDVTLTVPSDRMGEYVQLYEVITAPVDGHTVVVPYNEGTITITARIENIADVYVRFSNGATYWKGIKFTVIANGPTKYAELGDVLTRGRTPLPDLVDGEVGDTWIFTEASGWVHTNYPDYSESYW